MKRFSLLLVFLFMTGFVFANQGDQAKSKNEGSQKNVKVMVQGKSKIMGQSIDGYCSVLSMGSMVSNHKKNEFLHPHRSIDITITSDKGCKLHIVGTVYFSIIPPMITEFEGTVSLSGSGDCPHYTYHFSSDSFKGGKDIHVHFISNNLGNVVLNFKCSNLSVQHLLNEPSVIRSVENVLNSI